MGLISRFGLWLDYITAEKALKTDVDAASGRMEVFEKDVSDLTERFINQLEPMEQMKAEHLRLRDELTAIKAMLKMGGTRPVHSVLDKFDGSKAWER